MALAAPAPPPPRPTILLFPLGSAAPGAPAELPELITRHLAEALRRAGLAEVVVVRDGTPAPSLPAEESSGDKAGAKPEPSAESPSPPPLPLSPELSRLARTERATHFMTGGLTEFALPTSGQPGRAALRLMVIGVDGNGRRELVATVRVGRRPKSDALAAALADVAAKSATREFRSLLVAVPPIEPRGAAALLARGQEAMAAGDVAEARRRLDAAARVAPRDPRVNAALGDLLMHLNRPAAAISRYRQSLLFDPTNAAVWRGLLHALDRQGEPVELAVAAREAIAAGAGDAETWRFAALGDLAQGHLAAAESALRESFAREAAVGETIRAHAFFLALTGRRAEAVKRLEPGAREGYPDRIGLLARVRSLPVDPLAPTRDTLGEPTTPRSEAATGRAAVAVTAYARVLLVEMDAALAEGGEVGARRALASAAGAHALAAWWARVDPGEMARRLHEALDGALAAVLRAGAAAALAADRPWAGGTTLVARLRAEAASALDAVPALATPYVKSGRAEAAVQRMPKRGFEPPHPCGYVVLNHARLPFRHFGKGESLPQL